jgi:hypothetical protein
MILRRFSLIMDNFYFSWANQGDTVFGPEFYRYDEILLNFQIEHSEGNAPTLHAEIKNPRDGSGLLAPHKQIWAWLSWNDGGHVHPLFYGRLVGVPTDLFAEKITLQFVAQPFDFFQQKQAVAETLKTRPGYDPIWLDVAHRDDPDSILEGYSKLWHIGRTDSTVTVSDVLLGEDGTITFGSGALFAQYEGVSMQFTAAPIQVVNVDATVPWTQQDFGYVTIGERWFNSFSGGSLVDGWPQGGTSLGQGWTVTASLASDIWGIKNAINFTSSFQWQNKEKTHAYGDTMSINDSRSVPICGAPFIVWPVSWYSEGAYLDPDPDVQDRPTAKLQVNYVYVPQWLVYTYLLVQYEASRPRSEHLVFQLIADTQPILAELQGPILPPDSPIPTTLPRPPINPPLTETITLTASDVGQPIIAYDELSDQPLLDKNIVGYVPGTRSRADQNQITSLSWSGGYVTVVAKTDPGIQSGLIKVGNDIQISDSNYAGVWQIVSFAVINGYYPDGSPGYEVVALMPSNPGAPVPLPPILNEIIVRTGPVTSDKIVLNPQSFILIDNIPIAVLGYLSGVFYIPIGDQARRSYFPTDRGLWSLEHLIARARAKLRIKARCIEIGLTCQFRDAINLSCRMNAALIDRRLPGGMAEGKIIGYTISVDGQSGAAKGTVKFGCAVGNAGNIVVSSGTPTYAAPGYMDAGYQYMSGTSVTLAGGDTSVSYSVPADNPSDDGLVFPLNRQQAVASESVLGSLNDQIAVITQALQIMTLVNKLQVQPTLAHQEEAALLGSVSVESALAGTALTSVTLDGTVLGNHSIWYNLELRPVTNGPFNTEYQIAVSLLKLPKQINLESMSLP